MRLRAGVIGLLVLATAAPAFADGVTLPATAPERADVTKARDEFVAGAELVKKAQWAEALAAFERSAKLRPHAVTTYDIGACLRAMGQYTRARETFVRALAENDKGGGAQLSDSLVADSKGYIAEIDHLLATATVQLTPSNAAIAVDGRPLEVQVGAATPTLVAGTLPPGAGAPPPVGVFKLVLDPGVHVVTLSRKGFADAIVNRTFLPGSATELKLELDRLPATMHITSNEAGSVVTVNGADVGVAPVDVSRPAGSYRLIVKKDHFVTYESQVEVQAGEEANLEAKLFAEKTAITQTWWFWTAAGVVVAGAAVGTYFVTRTSPTPERPALDGGGLGWTLKVQ
jgi:hypothetical protein